VLWNVYLKRLIDLGLIDKKTVNGEKSDCYYLTILGKRIFIQQFIQDKMRNMTAKRLSVFLGVIIELDKYPDEKILLPIE
jgi:hypothetical protein